MTDKRMNMHNAMATFVHDGEVIAIEGFTANICFAAAHEIMRATSAIRNLIREDKLHQIYSQMQMGQEKYQMLTFNQSLFNLTHRGLITREEAIASGVRRLEAVVGVAAAGSSTCTVVSSI